jgi:hypothetical protein
MISYHNHLCNYVDLFQLLSFNYFDVETSYFHNI